MPTNDNPNTEPSLGEVSRIVSRIDATVVDIAKTLTDVKLELVRINGAVSGHTDRLGELPCTKHETQLALLQARVKHAGKNWERTAQWALRILNILIAAYLAYVLST